MDKSAVRHFAVTARTMLIRAVTQRAYLCAVTQDGNAPAAAECTPQEEAQRCQLIEHIEKTGFSQTMEEAAYLWFNRFTALRFMEVNGFLPSRIRVFSDESGAFKPEILSEAVHLDLEGTDRAHILELLASQDNDALYKYLLLSQCRALHRCLPDIFEDIGGWTELLFPDHLLRSDSILSHMVTDIPEADWRDQVQIIGWLYQYYNTELKDQVYAGLKRNIKIPAESVPAATQLFTPDWIVRYMVENSLGRVWAEGHGKPPDADWKYYLDEPAQEESVRRRLDARREKYRSIQPESLKLIDPCMGSGHVLVYAFELLMDIYTACGWSERDAALSILRCNLYGLDIDRRAYQLACFALMMKARQYNRSILKNGGVQPNLANFADVSGILEHADTCGSLLELPENTAQEPAVSEPQQSMLRRIKQMLTQSYDAVVTNPPYMGAAGMNHDLSAYVKAHYPDSKSDLFACFMERCGQLAGNGGYYAMLTMHSWMFLLRFEKLRNALFSHDVVNLLHLGANAFDTGDVGTIVQAAAFVIRKTSFPAYRGTFIDLRAYSKPEEKQNVFFRHPPAYERSQSDFYRVPGHPYAYWASAHTLSLFSGVTIGDISKPRQGMTTSDNQRFIRKWYEADWQKICFHASDCSSAQKSGKKWFPYNKGGGYRKWYGNQVHIVNFEDNGRELRAFHKKLNQTSAGGRIKNQAYYFRQAIAWTFIAITPGFRFCPEGSLFDVAGSSIFVEDADIRYVLAFLCSNTASYLLNLLNPTMNIQARDIKSLPYLCEERQPVAALTEENIRLCREDWDAFETSWDFERHPLV